MNILKILRRKIKASPRLHRLLYPAVHSIRRAHYLLFRTGQQHFRDCCYALSAALPEALFVNVGANDGITDTPAIRILLGNRNWKGMLIEPVPYCYERLKKNFPDTVRFILEQVAIGSTAGQRSMFYVEPHANIALPDLPKWYDKLGSFNRAHILKHFGNGIEPFIKETPVEVCTLTEVLRRNKISSVHLLHIDTEGNDWEVLRSLDFREYHPILIYTEHLHLSPEDKKAMRCFLKKGGYSIVDCGMDYFAYHRQLYSRCVRGHIS